MDHDSTLENTVVLRRKRAETATSVDQYLSASMDKNKKRMEDLRKMVHIKMSALNAIKSNIYRQQSDTKV